MKAGLKQRIAFALLMGIFTTGVISFTLISINIGFSQNFLRTWIRSWAISYIVVIPAILLVGPKIQSVVHRFVKP